MNQIFLYFCLSTRKVHVLNSQPQCLDDEPNYVELTKN